MTDITQALIPSVSALGEFIQEHVLKGYRLVEGWPIQYGWQFEIIMEKSDELVIAQPAPETRKAGRPAKQ